MRRFTISSILAVVLWQTPALAGTPLNLTTDVPRPPPQAVTMLERQFEIGQGSGWHIHHGVEMLYVAQGDMELRIGSEAVRILHAGDSFQVPRDTPHTALNIGQVQVKLIITYVHDKDAALKIPAGAPDH